MLWKCSSDLQTTLNLSNRPKGVPFNFQCSATVAWCKLTSLYFWSVETINISLYALARQLPLCQAQKSVWNRLIFLNIFLMLLHKLNEIFRANWTWISDCRASSILKRVPMSQDSKELCLMQARRICPQISLYSDLTKKNNACPQHV